MAVIKNRRASAADWTSSNPTLREGEIGVELGTGKFKMGNGSTPWNTLPYFVDETHVPDTDVEITNNGDGGYTINTIKLAAFSWVNSTFAKIADAVPLATTLPAALGVAFQGTALSAARGDHVHPAPAGRPNVLGRIPGSTGFMSTNEGSGPATPSLNRVNFAPHWVSTVAGGPLTISAIGPYVNNAAGAGGKVRHALFRCDQYGRADLTQKLYESGEIDSTTPGAKLYSVSLTLQPAYYWFGVVAHVASCGMTQSSRGALLQDPNVDANTFPMGYIDGVTGAFPTSGFPNANGDFAPNFMYTRA